MQMFVPGRGVGAARVGRFTFHGPTATDDALDKSLWNIVPAIPPRWAMTTKAFHDSVSSKEHRDMLSSCNVFLMDNLNTQMTFQSRPVGLYMRAEAGVIEEQCNATND